MNLATIAKDDRFGKLVVVRQSRSERAQGPRYRVRADCGRRLFVKASKLRSGEAQDCGRCDETPACKDRSEK